MRFRCNGEEKMSDLKLMAACCLVIIAIPSLVFAQSGIRPWGDSRCYGVFDSAQESWGSLNGRTAGTDWRLIIIDNEQENTFVNDVRIRLGTLSVWIGLHRDPSNSNRFRWVDGTPVTPGGPGFQRWAPGQPSSSSEPCVQFGTSGWEDQPCNLGRFGVFERVSCQ